MYKTKLDQFIAQTNIKLDKDIVLVYNPDLNYYPYDPKGQKTNGSIKDISNNAYNIFYDDKNQLQIKPAVDNENLIVVKCALTFTRTVDLAFHILYRDDTKDIILDIFGDYLVLSNV